MSKTIIDHPDYYHPDSIEAINVITAWELGFCLGNVIKYISRAGKKHPSKKLEDLEKAQWYLQREIETLKAFNRALEPESVIKFWD